MTRSGLLLLTALLALESASGPAYAAADGLLAAMVRDGLSTQPAGPATDMPSARMYDAQTLNPGALKRCLVSAHALDAAEQHIDATRRTVAALKVEADKAEARAEAATKAKSQRDAIADPPLIDALNGKRREFLAASATFRIEIARRNEAVAAFNRDCAGRKFYAGDLWTVRGDLPFDLGAYQPK